MDKKLEQDAQEFYRSFSELVRVYQFRDRTRICYYDVSVTQCYTISILVNHGSMGLNRLASQLCIDKSTASRVVDSLERKEYVKRLPDPDDGRALLLEVTAKGLDLHIRIEHDLIDEHKQLLADFDPEVRRAINDLIARLSRTASERFKSPEDQNDGQCIERVKR